MALELRPHQAAAREAVESELTDRDRATVIMPCATGKTLLQLVVANKYERVLILEPSLALIRQTLQRARQEEISASRMLLCVCSDQGVAKDEWKVDEDDLGIPVTTEASEIRVLLEGKQRVLAFCTYQSLPLLAAGMPHGFAFDVGIFDECHRTAGTADKKFGAGLHDSTLAIRKRLFTTATPKVFAVESGPEELRKVAHSMDDESTYGRTVFEMSVREAIEKGIICDYQVLVSATTEDMAQAALEKSKETMLPQSQAPVDLVAAQLSVLKAMEVTGARRVITYHSTIAEAQEFAADSLDLFRNAGVATFHIFGAMASNQRQAVIEAFLDHDGPAVITNARCLSEGVDVPAIDLVALMSKRESVVDVVQILGRALRPFPGKSTGYIMLPIFLDSSHSADQALTRSELAVTWEILHSILETEESPTEYHALAKPSFGTHRPGHVAGRGNLRVVAPDDLLETLERGITVRPVSRLGYANEQMLDAARAFKQREGHLRVPMTHEEGPYRLGAWLSRIRRLRTLGRLNPVVEKDLAAMGMGFGSRARTDSLPQIAELVARSGSFPEAWTKLSPEQKRWLRTKKRRKDEGRLSDDQLAAFSTARIDLDNLPVERHSSLDRLSGDAAFARNLEALKDFLITAGPTPTFGKARHNGVQLAEFLKRCRRELTDGVLAKERQESLDALPFDWRKSHRAKRNEESVNRYLKAIADFRKANGHMRLPAKREYKQLKNFVQSQRKNRGKLSPARLQALEAVGFVWSFEDEAWEMRLAELRRHRQAGTQISPSSALGYYLRKLERSHGEGNLEAEKLRVLEELGVPWARAQGQDIAMIARLTRIARKFGKVNVLSVAKRDADLSEWLATQFKAIQSGEADSALVDKLDKCGVRLPRRLPGHSKAAG